MKTKLQCVVDNQVKQWVKNGVLHREDGPAVVGRNYAAWYRHGLLHREDGPAVVKGEVKEYWFEGCMVSAAMLELHKTLTPEVDEILKSRKVIKIDCVRK
ncbi:MULTISPECIES: hypothetical protein [Ralstonia solanacearum species complex]|uniref:Uncharacterized protein n=1 Tax=Ralstonia solanacearum (strain UW551) TaxID=342110 RepID=A0AB33V9S6_RALSU|nr:hypothetical protein [Ralstonia solanacearum]EAP71602.1 Hypothetical Protein RRSL_01251 [Ralstonia solanacearum UW551]KLT21379.1 hypothetical protein CR47_0326875 [Ralstonia solanacearum]MDN4065626.1 hypothetical protein [Ralstonia solanacearum]NUU73383.1 hypothetical protein [Ralstonia solanacearum]QHB59504.1 hypothetical protein GRD98_10700 [Ralstonia solanacearum]